MFLSLPVGMFGSVVLLPLSILLFLDVSWWEFCFFESFFVGLVAILFLTNTVFSLKLLELLVFVAHDFDFELSS